MFQILLSILVLVIALIYLIKKFASGKPHCDPEVSKCSSCVIKDSCKDDISKNKKAD
ncbi:MAG: hypothetical protein KAS62_05865 [Candidatus Delongbacteria bacterium]|nr:hypothetical protein [Candidatus Delongbacteria bacterium]